MAEQEKQTLYCPFNSNRLECSENCAIWNKNLKGCCILSLTISVNKIAQSITQTQQQKYVKDSKEWEHKYSGKSKEEMEKQLFPKSG